MARKCGYSGDVATEVEQIQLRENDVVWRAVDDEIIVLDRRTWGYISVNFTGATLWQDVVDGTTRTQLVDKLVSAFNVDKPKALADVDSFVTMLEQHDLLEASP
jgi:hypothetical protein